MSWLNKYETTKLEGGTGNGRVPYGQWRIYFKILFRSLSLFHSFEFFQLNLNRHFKWFISTSHGKIMPICNKNGNNEKLRTWFYLCFFKETK